MVSSYRLSFYLLLIGLGHSFAAIASIAPPGQTEPAQAIRVSLGLHSRGSLAGHDLLINGKTPFIGDAAFSVRCGTDENSLPYVEFGTGIRSARRIDVTAPSGFLHFNSKLYRNRISVISKGGHCLVINTLDLEKYLAGLINKEMMPSWPLEALKAQAVASRSYALYQIRRNSQKEFDLESTTQDQVYDGAASETARSSRAVAETRRLVLSDAAMPLKAYFHANCGGITEIPQPVWGNASPSFKPVHCPYHRAGRDRLRWSHFVSKSQLESALKRAGGLLPQNFFRIASLEAGHISPRRRLTDVRISDQDGRSLAVSAPAFRNAIGNTKIKSTAFQIEKERDGFRISGEGFGHGVGMCQVGARAMADEGKNFRQILTHYYPLAKIIGL